MVCRLVKSCLQACKLVVEFQNQPRAENKKESDEMSTTVSVTPTDLKAYIYLKDSTDMPDELKDACRPYVARAFLCLTALNFNVYEQLQTMLYEQGRTAFPLEEGTTYPLYLTRDDVEDEHLVEDYLVYLVQDAPERQQLLEIAEAVLAEPATMKLPTQDVKANLLMSLAYGFGSFGGRMLKVLNVAEDLTLEELQAAYMLMSKIAVFVKKRSRDVDLRDDFRNEYSKIAAGLATALNQGA